ncbi:MAG: YbaB/EbfC family nucleoid-associated protein [Luteibaculaceae bacterium]
MPQVHIERPENYQENVKLSVEKLKSIFVVGESDTTAVRVYLNGNGEFKSVNVKPEALQKSSAELEAELAKALTMALEGVKKVKRAELRGRLTLNAHKEKLWDIIDQVIA